MADNVDANSGSGGATFKTDEDTGASAHVPVTKIELGVNNTFDGFVGSTNPMPCGGPAAENAAVSGNPLLTGGRYDASPRTLGDGDVGAIALDSDGAVQISDGGNTITVDGTVTANLGATDNAVLDQIEVNTSYGDQTGGGTEASALRVTLANNSTGLLSVDDNGGSLTIDNTDITTIAGAVSGSEMQVDVVAALPAGTNNIGDVDIASAIPAGANLVGDVGISGARTSGGTTLYKNIDVDESEDQVKGTAGQVYWIHAINLRTTPVYLKFYNATAASVTVGTTTPDLTFPVPSAGDANGGGFTISIPNGIAFGTAITIAVSESGSYVFHLLEFNEPEPSNVS